MQNNYEKSFAEFAVIKAFEKHSCKLGLQAYFIRAHACAKYNDCQESEILENAGLLRRLLSSGLL